MSIWNNFEPLRQGVDIFCEANGEGLLAQPANSLTSASYLIIGLYILLDTWREREHSQDSLFKLLLGVSVIGLGLGSIFRHASNTQVGGVVDVTAMLLVVLSILFLQLKETVRLPRQYYLLSYILVGILHPVFIYPEINQGVLIFMILMTSVIGIEFSLIWKMRVTAEFKYLKLGVGLFLIASIAWILDVSKVICMDHSLFQLHAIWHLLTALAILALYPYLKTRNIRSEPLRDHTL